jgi:uncharacterized membrane protein YqjE
MAILETVGRIGGTLLDMARTRLELAAVEIEEETQRVIGYFVLALAALILFGIAMVLIALTVILVFWDTHRIGAAMSMAALFGAGAVIAGYRLKAGFANRPRFMSATAAELNKDLNFIRNGPFE